MIRIFIHRVQHNNSLTDIYCRIQLTLISHQFRYGVKHLGIIRCEFLGFLQGLAGTVDSPNLVADINRLLKLAAMASYSREKVARLSGDDWVTFLNGNCPVVAFSAEQGQLLAVHTYTGQAIGADTGHQLLAASLAWVQRHENSLDD